MDSFYSETGRASNKKRLGFSYETERRAKTVNVLFFKRWSLKSRLGLRDAGAGRAGGFLEGGLVLVVDYVVSTLHRKRWEEGEWRAVLRTNLSLMLKMGYI